MARKVREDLAKSNPYYISKFRRKELKYFCLQYYEWKKYLLSFELRTGEDEWDDPTGDEAVERTLAKEKMTLVEKISINAGEDIKDYILIAVTQDLSYADMQKKYIIPCGRDYFYDRLHKFYYLLSQEKH